ncbi:MAG: carboxypeptidase regulatory-like domain-containing protein [Methanophagales archaeon]|nr:carboxypeptidase regulatory-like domain-containing protein [Methanophagales archaeon]
MSGVNVSAGGKSIDTGRAGKYALLEVPVGSQEVKAEKVDYITKRERVTVIAGQTTTKNFQLAFDIEPRPPGP